MAKRKFVWGAIVVAFLIGAAGIAWNLFGLHEVKMTQSELQQKIDLKMPHMTKNGVTVSSVQLDLTGDKIGLVIVASATKLKTDFVVKAETKGTLTYNNMDGTFHFKPDELKLVDVKTNGESVANRVDRLVEKWVTSKKVLDNKDEVTKAAADLVNSMVQKSAEVTLEHIPVYKMPDTFKGNVARMFLKSVEVKDQTIIAHLSFWQFTKMLMLYGFILVLAIGFAIAMFTCPELFVAAAIIGSIGN